MKLNDGFLTKLMNVTFSPFKSTPDSEAMVVSIDGNSSVCVPLMQCVHKTQAVARAMSTKNWEVAVQLRGSGFKRNLDTFLMLTQVD